LGLKQKTSSPWEDVEHRYPLGARVKGKVLGLKQKTSSPWEDVEHRYPLGARVKGKVVNVMNYGVFIRLEDGIEGLVHISEMSWIRRLAHPGEIVNLGDEIEV